MYKNYFKTAFRTFFRNKLYTSLNIAGLTFGLSCFILIGLYLFDELTFDQQHSKSDRIYRIIEYKNVSGETLTVAGAGYKLAEESKNKISAVENTTRIQRTGRANIANPENPSNFFQETVTVADQGLLDIFDFPFIQGDKRSALKDPNTIIITQDLAMRLFNKTDVVGKTLEFRFSNPALSLKVTGVVKNHPRNSSFDFSSVISEASMTSDSSFMRSASRDWVSENFLVYALLRPNTNAGAVAGQMTRLARTNVELPVGTTVSFGLQALKDVHLNSENIVDAARNSNVEAMAQGNNRYIKIFSFISFFFLLIAGINYVNLTTARASSRLKEIGVRKTIGALQNNLMKQFLFESLLLTIISFLLSVAVVNLVLPAFNGFTNKQLSLNFNTDYRIWMYAILFAVLTGLISGSYPALLLSRLKPFLLLKGIKLQGRSGLSLRKGLVVFQFTVSIVLIIATMVLFLQVKYLNNTNLGFDKNLLVVIDVNTRLARSNYDVVKANMQKIPSVQSVAVTSRVPGEWKSYRTIKVKSYGSTAEHSVAYMFGADKDFLSTYDIKLLKGKNFDSPADSANVLINETAAKLLGITEANGQTIEIPEVSRNADGRFTALNTDHIAFKPKVVGIVKDFHFQSLRDKIEPLIICFTMNPIQLLDYYTAKINSANITSTLEKLKAVMVKNDENDPFEYHFLNDQLALFYIEDGRRQTILIWAALATIFIACLGLFGLATYSTEQRVKEIGVRKVLGASVLNLTTLLSKDFLKLVLIASVIAFPIAWWATAKWLQEYAYHIKVEWWFFILAGVFACVIALITVSYQAIKAAITNPVKSLRTE